MQKKCDICNGTHKVHLTKDNKYLCNKHYLQMYRHGKIFDKTTWDKNDYSIHEDYIEIILRDKKCVEVARAIIDKCDYDKVKDYSWCFSDGYCETTIKRKNVGIHCFILPNKIGFVNDHKDRDRLNNRQNNLRYATEHQNSINRSIQSNNTSGITGVFWEKYTNKWRAILKLNGKNKSLGRFLNINDAIKARREAEIKYFGEFSPNYKAAKGFD